MTASEALNLIDWLRAQGFDNNKVVECIEAVEVFSMPEFISYTADRQDLQ